MVFNSEQIVAERLADAVETSTDQPGAPTPLKPPEGGPLGSQRPGADKRNDAAVSGDLSELLEVSQAFLLI